LVQYTNTDEKYTKRPQNIPNGHKIYQTAIKYTKRPWQGTPKYTKISIWYENRYTIWQPWFARLDLLAAFFHENYYRHDDGSAAGLPDGYIFIPKIPIWVNLG
jgi:hypothetical protein